MWTVRIAISILTQTSNLTVAIAILTWPPNLRFAIVIAIQPCNLPGPGGKRVRCARAGDRGMLRMGTEEMGWGLKNRDGARKGLGWGCGWEEGGWAGDGQLSNIYHSLWDQILANCR